MSYDNLPPIQKKIRQEEDDLRDLLATSKDKTAIQAKREKIEGLKKSAETHNHQLFVIRSLNAFRISFEDLTSNSKSLTREQAENRAKEKDATWGIYKDLTVPNRFRFVKKTLPVAGLKNRLKKIMATCENVRRSGLVTTEERDLLLVQHVNLMTSFMRILDNLEIGQGHIPVVSKPTTEKILLGQPTRELLTEFHVCGRKKFYVFEKDAIKAAQGTDLTRYACVYCSGFHLGHASPLKDSGNVIASEYAQRHRRTWGRFPVKAQKFLEHKGIM